MKRILITIIFMTSMVTQALAAQKGQAFDLARPAPVSDPDSIHDEGAFKFSVLSGSGGKRSTKLLNLNLGLRKFSKSSALSLSFLYSTYAYSLSYSSVTASGGVNTGMLTADATVMGLELYYNRTTFKRTYKENWYPSVFSFSWYGGFGLCQSEMLMNLAYTGPMPAPDIMSDSFRYGMGSHSAEFMMMPFNFGIINNFSVNRRFGMDFFLNISQDFVIASSSKSSDTTLTNPFLGQPKPVITVGTEMYLRRMTRVQYPWEYGLGIYLTPSVNDIENSMLMNIGFSIRRRW